MASKISKVQAGVVAGVAGVFLLGGSALASNTQGGSGQGGKTQGGHSGSGSTQSGQGTTTTSSTGVNPQDGQGDNSDGGDAGSTDSQGQDAAPVAGQTVDAGAAQGTVEVELPGSTHAVPLTSATSIPVGALIDATHGVVTLTSVKRAGVTQTGQFWGARFRVKQTGGAHPVTQLALADPHFGTCTATHRAGRLDVVAARRRRRVSLWGRDSHGSFSTRGRGAVAVVRGTVWLTQDSCAGTLVRVSRGAVSVRDLHRHRTVLVRAGHSYLARS